MPAPKPLSESKLKIFGNKINKEVTPIKKKLKPQILKPPVLILRPPKTPIKNPQPLQRKLFSIFNLKNRQDLKDMKPEKAKAPPHPTAYTFKENPVKKITTEIVKDQSGKLKFIKVVDKGLIKTTRRRTCDIKTGKNVCMEKKVFAASKVEPKVDVENLRKFFENNFEEEEEKRERELSNRSRKETLTLYRNDDLLTHKESRRKLPQKPSPIIAFPRGKFFEKSVEPKNEQLTSGILE